MSDEGLPTSLVHMNMPEGSTPTADGGYEYEPASGAGPAPFDHPDDCECEGQCKPPDHTLAVVDDGTEEAGRHVADE